MEDWRNTSLKIAITKQDYYARVNFVVGNVTEIPKKQPQTEVSIINKQPLQTGSKIMTSQVFLHGKAVPDAIVFVRNPSEMSKNV